MVVKRVNSKKPSKRLQRVAFPVFGRRFSLLSQFAFPVIFVSKRTKMPEISAPARPKLRFAVRYSKSPCIFPCFWPQRRVRVPLRGQPASRVSLVRFPGLWKAAVFPQVRPPAGNLRQAILQILARRPPVLERLSLAGIFQFPFWCGRDRFEMCERTVREAS